MTREYTVTYVSSSGNIRAIRYKAKNPDEVLHTMKEQSEEYARNNLPYIVKIISVMESK